jgi:branched-chain amino acid transport system permease protein
VTTFLTYTILGLVLGSVYAIAASGLVLTYTTSGVFNFAHGAQAMIGAFVHWQLAVGWGLPGWLAVTLVVGVMGPLTGLLLHVAIMKWLRDTAEVTKIVATVSVLLGLISLSHWLWDPRQPRVAAMFFGSDAQISIGGVIIRVHELICIVVAVVLASALRLMFTASRLGIAMRATVDDPDLLRLRGHDPDRVAAVAWALGSTLAMTAGVLITPISGGALSANALTLLVMDCFAVAVFARLRSIPRCFVAAIALGLAMTYVVAYLPASTSWAGNVRVSLPMIALFAALMVLPQDRLRGAAVRTRERYRVPSTRSALGWAVALVVCVYLVRLLIDDGSVATLALGVTFGIIGLSLVPLTGYAGELNLAPLSIGAVSTIIAYHLGVVGIGLASRLTVAGLAAGVLGAALVGGLVALPALRLRGLHLALATIAFGVVVSNLVLRDTAAHRLFGTTFALFPGGTLIVPPLRVGGLDLRDGGTLLMTSTIVFALLGVGFVALRNSGYGRRLVALSDSPVAIATLGQNPATLKFGVFTLSAATAGLGGILMASAIGAVSSDNFIITSSLALVMFTVFAGVARVAGALLAGLAVGAGFPVFVGTFNNLAVAHPDSAEVYRTLSNVLLTGTALLGLTIARHPSGIVHRIAHAYRGLRDLPALIVIGLVLEGVLYLLTYAGVLGNWWFALLTCGLIVVLPLTGRMMSVPVAARRDQSADPTRGGADAAA